MTSIPYLIQIFTQPNSDNKINIGSNNQPPNLSVGGVKMRERKTKGVNPLRVISQNKIKEISNNYEDETHKNNGRRKPAHKVIRAGSLVRK